MVRNLLVKHIDCFAGDLLTRSQNEMVHSETLREGMVKAGFGSIEL